MSGILDSLKSNMVRYTISGYKAAQKHIKKMEVESQKALRKSLTATRKETLSKLRRAAKSRFSKTPGKMLSAIAYKQERKAPRQSLDVYLKWPLSKLFYSHIHPGGYGRASTKTPSFIATGAKTDVLRRYWKELHHLATREQIKPPRHKWKDMLRSGDWQIYEDDTSPSGLWVDWKKTVGGRFHPIYKEEGILQRNQMRVNAQYIYKDAGKNNWQPYEKYNKQKITIVGFISKRIGAFHYKNRYPWREIAVFESRRTLLEQLKKNGLE